MAGILTLLFLISPNKSYAFLGDGGAGWANAVYLAKILMENVKRYQQLKLMIDQTKNSERYIKLINLGIDNSIGLINSLPIKDERVFEETRSYGIALNSVNNLYGEIPKSMEFELQLLHDQSVAESLKMVNASKEYSRQQEGNALKISIQSRQASPKGAARMNAEINAQILHTLNQILRINGQMLKLQSESLAFNNKEGKDSVFAHQKVQRDMKYGPSNFHGDFNFPKF